MRVCVLRPVTEKSLISVYSLIWIDLYIMYLFASIVIFGRSVYSMSNYNKYARNVCQKVFRYLLCPIFTHVHRKQFEHWDDYRCFLYQNCMSEKRIQRSCSVLTENTSTLHTQFHNDSFIRVTQEILPFRYVISILKFTYEYDSIC